MRRTNLSFSLCILAAACSDDSGNDSSYCGIHDGDAYCGRVAPERPYCAVLTETCFFPKNGLTISPGADLDGCVAEFPAPECRLVCGLTSDDDCIAPDPTTGQTTSNSTSNSTTTHTHRLRCTSGSAPTRSAIITTRRDHDAMVCPGVDAPTPDARTFGNTPCSDSENDSLTPGAALVCFS